MLDPETEKRLKDLVDSFIESKLKYRRMAEKSEQLNNWDASRDAINRSMAYRWCANRIIDSFPELGLECDQLG